MGRKKKHTAPNSKQLLSPPSSTAAAEAEPTDLASIKLECEKALTSFRCGSYNKAIRLMKESCSRHQHSLCPNSPCAGNCMYLRSAVESARKAVELSPSSIEFGHFYANLLYEVANDAREYEEVVRESHRALFIENPIDPAKGSLQVEAQHKILTPEARIANVQEELRSLIQKSNLGSLETLIFPFRRMAEDPIESNLIQSRRPNEIKKATKTPEERRKEIEVRVAPARSLQQKSESSSSDNVNNKGSDPILGLEAERGESMEMQGKNGSTQERRDMVKSYWESTSKEAKKDLLRVKVSDLKSHFSASKDGNANDIISEALSFCEANKTWRFWVCHRCSEKFMDSEAHMYLNIERIEMLLCSPWKPLDLLAAAKMLCSQQTTQTTEFNEFHSGDYMEDGDCYFQDAWNDTSPEKKILEMLAMLLVKIRVAFELLIRHNYLSASHYDKVLQFTVDELQNIPSGLQLVNRGLGQSPTCICFLEATQLSKILKFLQDLSQTFGLSRYSEQSNPKDEVNNFGDLSLEVTEEIRLDGEDSCLLLDEKLLGTDSGDIANGKNVSSVTDRFLSWIFTGPSSEEQIVSWMRTKEKKTNKGVEIMEILEKEFCHLQNLCEKKREHLSYEGALQTVEDLFLEEGRKRETSAEFTRESYESVLRRRIQELNETNVLKDADSLNHNQFGYEESYACTGSQLRDLESGEADEWGMKDSFSEADSFIEIAIQKQKEQLSAEIELVPSVKSTCGHIWRHWQRNMPLRRPMLQAKHSSLSSLLILRRRPEEEMIIRNTTEEKSKDKKKNKETKKLKLSAKTTDQSRASRCSEPWSVYNRETAATKNSASHAARRRQRSLLGGRGATANRQRIQYRSQQLLSSAMRMSAHQRQRLAEPPGARPQHRDEQVTASRKPPSIPRRPIRRSPISRPTQRQGNRFRVRLNRSSQQILEAVRATNVIDKPIVLEPVHPQTASIRNEYHFNVDSIEHNLPPLASSGDPSEADIVPEALKEEEEQYRRRIELVLEERKLEETLEYQRKIENEAKEKHIAEQQKKCSSLVPVNIAEAVYDVCRDNVVDDLELQEQISQVTVDECKWCFPSTNHCAISDAAVVQDVKSQKVVTNGVATQVGAVQSDQRTGRRVGPSESINSESHRSDTDKERKSKTLCSNGDAGTKTLRQLQAEEDEEENFQADLKKAVRQSLGGRDVTSCPRTALEVNIDGVSDVTKELFGTGLRNEVGEYNCFLNVIIQSLWNLGMFRAKFLRSSTLEHHHVGDPCIVCSLYEIFTALSAASREAQMNDASEVLAVIFDCLHRSFSQSSSVSDTESSENNCTGSWDCANRTCIAHSMFGMNIFDQLNCFSCGLESRHMNYTSFFHNINSSALRTMKVTCAENSFDELLNLVEMNHQLACDSEAGGCGKPNHIHHILTTPPHVFTTGWQNTCESVEDIAATIAALNTEIDISVIYRGLDPKSTYSLASVVCYYGQHYHCFSYSHEHDRWIMYDDKTVKVIGSWSDVLSMCERGHLQPQVLLYEKC
ncbi:hypothetical protein Bca52824_023090 [Brassica carinata]|uniref:USP domain-containing protein n=1 Tax=Brassica carinata TaxID=52824 RepID=A0A8X7VI02_BRACI|nr:hypothetical protein Bca52824_023090 [Brassica carinata]